MFLAKLNEGQGESLNMFANNFPISVLTDGNIQWQTDYSSMNLCSPNFAPFIVPGNASICCSESFLYLHGFDSSLPSLNLPAPTSIWNTQGSFCMYVFLSSLTPILASNNMVLFSFLPINTTFSYDMTNMILNMKYQNTAKATLTFAFTNGTWDSLCFVFDTTTGNTIYTIYEAAFNGMNSYTDVGAVLNFSPNGGINFLPGNPQLGVSFKNILILNKSITMADFTYLYWGNM